MDEEEDDDIYAPANGIADFAASHEAANTGGAEKAGADLEEGEEEGEEGEESDSDIDIITERKEEPKADAKVEALQAQRASVVKSSTQKTPSVDHGARRSPFPVVKVETPTKATPPRSGASYPAIKTSQIDVDARPIYGPNGKPITAIDMDADFPEDDKPWRRPGTDMTDYFNYGFDEFTWASYCLKQETLRKEVADSKKQMEDMQNFLGMPGMPPAMPGMPAAAPGSMPSMGGDMPPEMAQMMQQMMASGMDPSQMTPDMFMQQMMQGQAGSGGQNNYGGGQGYGQQGQNHQQMVYGYGAGGGGGGGGGGRGRGNRRNW